MKKKKEEEYKKVDSTQSVPYVPYDGVQRDLNKQETQSTVRLPGYFELALALVPEWYLPGMVPVPGTRVPGTSCPLSLVKYFEFLVLYLPESTVSLFKNALVFVPVCTGMYSI